MKRTFLCLLFGLTCLSAFSQNFERYKSLGDTVLVSDALGYKKHLEIMVPLEYQQGLTEMDFPLIVIFDSQNERSYNFIRQTIDYLTSNEQMPSAVVVGVASVMEHRYQETQMASNDPEGKGLENEQFIFEELIPFCKENYHAGNFTLLMGHSRYGYFTTHLLNKRHKDLNAVISLSPFFTGGKDDLVESVTQLFDVYSKQHHLYYRFGIGGDYPEDYSRMNQALADQQASNTPLDIKGVLFKEADHNVTPGLTAGIALYEVFEYWSNRQTAYFDNANDRFDILDELRTEIEAHYGYPLRFSLGTLNGKGWFFYNEKKYEKAIKAWEVMLEAYPNFVEGYLYIAYAQKALGLDYSESLAKCKAGLRQSEVYTPEEVEELLQEINDF